MEARQNVTDASGTGTSGTMGSWVSHVDETKRGLAKLLAKENVTVRHAKVRTASFDLKTRVLTLPLWENISVDQYDLLIGHEVGHAKYSDDLDSLLECKKSRGLHTYINVLEDTRIERLMKEEFPGLRPAFRRGYERFATDGTLFQLTKPVAEYSFIDRINIQYKIGAYVAVPFSDAERLILARIDRLRTMRDAVNLAKELYEAAKHDKNQPEPEPEENTKRAPKREQKRDESDENESDQSGDETEPQRGDSDDAKESEKSDESDETGDEQGDGETDGDETDGDESSKGGDDAKGEPEETTKGDSDAGDESTDEDPTSETDVANGEALDKLANDAAADAISAPPAQVTLGVVSDDQMRLQTVTNAQYVGDTLTYLSAWPDLNAKATAFAAEFHVKHAKTIASMAIEFDRRKTAKRLERAKVSRTGKLDMSKLHAYKFRDDLFQSVTILPNGQSHGIVMILDASGSMSGVMTDTLEQVMMFASFAQKSRIPFRAYAYTERPGESRTWTEVPEPMNVVMPTQDFTMVNLFDSTAKNWKDQFRAVSAFAVRYQSYSYSGERTGVNGLPHTELGSTPLNSSLLFADRYLAQMKTALHLEKMTLVVCTDGDDTNGLRLVTDRTSWTGKTVEGTPCIVRDSVTRKSYSLFNVGVSTWTEQTEYTAVKGGSWAMVIDVLKTRHDCRVVALKIAPRLRLSKRFGTDRILEQGKQFWTPAVRANDRLVTGAMKIDAVKQYNDNGQIVMPTSLIATDAAVILSTSAMETVDADDDFTKRTAGSTNVKQIAKAFAKANVAAVSNKVFINAVMPFIA